MFRSTLALLLAPVAIASQLQQRDAAQTLADLQQTSGAMTTATNQLNAWKPSSGAFGAFQVLQNMNTVGSLWNKSATDAATVPAKACQDVTNLFNYISSNLSAVSNTYTTTIINRKSDLTTQYNLQPTIFSQASNLRENVIKVFNVLIPKACTAGQGQDLKDQIENNFINLIYNYGPTVDGRGTSFEDVNILLSDAATFTSKVNNLTVNSDNLYRLFAYFKHYSDDLNRTNADFRLYYGLGCADSKVLANQLATTVAPNTQTLLKAIISKKAAIAAAGTFYRDRIEGYLKDMRTLTDGVGHAILDDICSSYRASITNTFNGLASYYNSAVGTYAA